MSQTHRTSSRCVRVVAYATLAVLVSGVPVAALAQAPANETGSLTGVVQDARGLPLLGAFVAAIPLGADQPEGIAVTDARGQFGFSGLGAGVYTLLVGSLGFAGTVVQGINVPGAAPLAVQLEAQSDRQLASLESPLDLGWALRSGRRDVLRQTETTLVSDVGETTGGTARAWAPAVANRTLPSELGGEVRLWSFAKLGDRQTVGVTSLSLGSSDSWNIRAHVGDRGALWARSDVSRDLGGGHTVAVGFGYVGGNFEMLPGREEEHDSWVGRLQVQDTWALRRNLELSFGAAYERQNYMASQALVSPHVAVTYEPWGGTRFHVAARRTAEGMNLTSESAGFEIVSLLGQSNLVIGDSTGVHAQRSLRYEVGLEQSVGAAQLRVKAYYDEVTDELLGVYVKAPDGVNNYLLFNVGDAAARGFELGLAGPVTDSVSGEVVYAYRDRGEEYAVPVVAETGPATARELAEWEATDTHEFRASLAAEVEPLRTNVFAVYNWRYGLPVMRDGEVSDSYGRFDVRVLQPLPFRALDTEWSAMVHVRNLLGPRYEGVYNVSLAELLGLTRGIAGGLAVKF